MNRRSRTFRVFVSSTFSDLKAERNALQEHVFPKLRELCERHGCQFQAIDLRWGVSQEAALDQQAMTICLQELKRCQDLSPRPNFIVLLGDRYGWQPLPLRIDATAFARLMDCLTDGERARLVFDEARPTVRQGKGNGWYRLDRNAVFPEIPDSPGEYVLLPREPDSRFAAFENWEAEECELLTLLRRAAETVYSDPGDERRDPFFQSPTHQEIEHGALRGRDNDPHPVEHVLCRQRAFDRAAIVPSTDPARAEFLDLMPRPESIDGKSWKREARVDEAAWDRQHALKRTLSERLPPENLRVVPAPWPWSPTEDDLGPMCRFFTERLAAIIEAEIATLETVNPLDRENETHLDFARDRARHFVGRADLLGQIADYLDGDVPQPLIVHGVSGTGKTALMAQAFLRLAKDSDTKESPCHWLRLIGATPGSAQIRSLLTDLGRQIDRAWGVETGDIPDDINRFHEWFRERLARAKAERPIVLFLDALDQLGESDHAHTLAWLPRQLPAEVRLVVSILDRPGEAAGRVLETARRCWPEAPSLAVQALTASDGGALLDLWLADAGRRLDGAARSALLEAWKADGLPLWLKLAAEEARRWRSFEAVSPLPGDISALFGQMLRRLQEPENHGELIVDRALGYLAAARRGLSESEMLDVLAADEGYWEQFRRSVQHDLPGGVRRLPVILWARLHADLAAYLSQQEADGALLLGFYHRLLCETVEQTFLAGEARGWRHDGLAAYFLGQTHFIGGDLPGPDRRPRLRKLAEAPQAAIRATAVNEARWDDLIGSPETPACSATCASSRRSSPPGWDTNCPSTTTPPKMRCPSCGRSARPTARRGSAASITAWRWRTTPGNAAS
jgi:hypothetical protein